MTTHFRPTADELDTLRRVASGQVEQRPTTMRSNHSDRLFENGFLTVGLAGGLALTPRGEALLQAHAEPAD